MDLEKYRTGSKRIWAAIVDGIVFMPLALIEQWIYKSTTAFSVLFAWAAFVAFAPLLYSILLHYKTGQTIGKWVAGVKVLDRSETKTLTLSQSVYRDSFYLLVATCGLGYHSYLLAGSNNAEDTISNFSLISYNTILGWTLLELITMLTNPKRRAVHDYLARSVVVRSEQ